VCLPSPRSADLFDDYRRVGKALVEAFRNVYRDTDEELCCELEEFTYGWAALPACNDLLSKQVGAAENATRLGAIMAEHRIAATKAAVGRKLKQQEEERRKQQEAETAAINQQQEPAADPAPDHSVVVARLSAEEMKNTKLKDILGPLKSVTNIAW
jgi:ATP-dependent Lon protease